MFDCSSVGFDWMVLVITCFSGFKQHKHSVPLFFCVLLFCSVICSIQLLLYLLNISLHYKITEYPCLRALVYLQLRLTGQDVASRIGCFEYMALYLF